MSTTNPTRLEQDDSPGRAEFYDGSINWAARLGREIPVLVDVLGPPGDGRILDAGCGSGRQALALAQRGYRIVGADINEGMLEVARRNAQTAGQRVDFVLSPFATLYDATAHAAEQREKGSVGFDGLYCLGNSLASSGTRQAGGEAIEQFARCLRPGGRLFIQVANYHRMRSEHPCVRGPRVAVVDGVERVSVRQYHFTSDSVEVTNITLWRDDAWKCRKYSKTLYPVTLDDLETLCDARGLRIDHVWGDYARRAYVPDESFDLLIAATRV